MLPCTLAAVLHSLPLMVSRGQRTLPWLQFLVDLLADMGEKSNRYQHYHRHSPLLLLLLLLLLRIYMKCCPLCFEPYAIMRSCCTSFKQQYWQCLYPASRAPSVGDGPSAASRNAHGARRPSTVVANAKSGTGLRTGLRA